MIQRNCKNVSDYFITRYSNFWHFNITLRLYNVDQDCNAFCLSITLKVVFNVQNVNGVAMEDVNPWIFKDFI